MYSPPNKALGIKNMATNLTPNQALVNIVKALENSKKDLLWNEIEVLRNLIGDSKKQKTLSFWLDEAKKERAKQAMRESWKSRKPYFRLSWRSTGSEIITQNLDEISKLTGKTINTFRTLVSTGKGFCTISYMDDVIEVTKLPPVYKNASL